MTTPFRSAAIYDDTVTGVSLAAAMDRAGLSVVLVAEDPGAAERASVAASKLSAQSVTFVVPPHDATSDIIVLGNQAAHATQPRATLRIALNTTQKDAIPMSFAAPVHAGGLVEVGHDGLTTLAAAQIECLLKQLGKPALRVRAYPDFPGQCLADAYQAAVDVLLCRHTTPWALDDAMQAAGWRDGPCLRQDAEGLDRAYLRRRRVASGYWPEVPAVDRAVQEGRLGRSIGWGWYRYPGGGGPVDDPLVEDLLEEEAWLRKTPRVELTDQELCHRVDHAVLNAAITIIGSDHAAPDDVAFLADQLLGYPPEHGGLLGTLRGIDPVAFQAELLAMSGAYPWQPSPHIADVVARLQR